LFDFMFESTSLAPHSFRLLLIPPRNSSTVHDACAVRFHPLYAVSPDTPTPPLKPYKNISKDVKYEVRGGQGCGP